MFAKLIPAFLLGFVVWHVHGHDDVLLLKNVALANLNAAVLECVNLCVHSIIAQMPLAACYYKCDHEYRQNNATRSLVTFDEVKYRVELVCRTDSILTIAIQRDDPRQQQVGAGGLYIIEVIGPAAVAATILATAEVIQVVDLRAGTEYVIHGSVLSSANKVDLIVDRRFVTLLFDYVPQSVRNISRLSFNEGADALLTVTFKWMVPTQRACHYDALWHSSDADDDDELQERAITVMGNDQQQGQAFSIERLAFGKHYKLAIQAKSATRAGDLIWMDIKTPSCLEWSGYDLNQCSPPLPERLSVLAIEPLLRPGHFDISVAWKAPKVPPHGYRIQLFDFDPSLDHFPNVYAANVSANATSYSFKSMLLLGNHIEVMLTAFSPGGQAEVFVNKYFDRDDSNYRGMSGAALWRSTQWPFVTLIVLMITFWISLISYYCFRRRCPKTGSTEDVCHYFHRLEGGLTESGTVTASDKQKLMLKWPIDDNMEVERHRIEVLNDLGEGEFGMVKCGRLLMGQKDRVVAIKMLKNSPTSDEIAEFRREIDVMKSVGVHPNIVSMVGHYTRDIDDLMLLTEYCSSGNLLNYLRRAWNVFNNDCCFAEDGMYAEIVDPQLHSNAVENKGYDLTMMALSRAVMVVGLENDKIACLKQKQILSEKEQQVAAEPLTLDQSDLLSIALQIASGMEFLSKNKVIHRDLAARNVLVCDRNIVKIADFGLSRDIYQNSVYRKKTKGKLPIKWMALESLTHQIYTSQSDVWSYGVLLYEIMTFGSTPYPALANESVLEYIQAGCRMERPANCDEFVYQLMLACWNACANQRPTFTSIGYQLRKMMEACDGVGGGVDIEADQKDKWADAVKQE